MISSGFSRLQSLSGCSLKEINMETVSVILSFSPHNAPNRLYRCTVQIIVARFPFSASYCLHLYIQPVFFGTLLKEKVLYRTLKGSISATYVFGTPKRFYTFLKKGFLWVLYRTLGFHTWPIEPFTRKKW